jgi:hypothetical protein
LDGVHLGVAIMQSGDGHHVGLLYRLDDSVRLLHLGWHRDLRDQPVSDGMRYLWAPIELTQEEQVALSAMASEVAVNVQPTDLRYGLDWNYVDSAGLFDSEDKVIVYPVGKGVTCATFLYALFMWWGYKPVDSSTWKNLDGDEVWQAWVVSLLAGSENEDSCNQARELAADVGCLRLRPEQIAAACAFDVDAWPLAFDDACELAADVVAQVAFEAAKLAGVHEG